MISPAVSLPDTAFQVDLDLVRKYNVAGPRYTSYPPATHFTEAIGAEQVAEGIRANNEQPRDLSLYFHLPFCYSLCWFCGCTTVITGNQDASRVYVQHLDHEIGLLHPWLHPGRRVTQLHFGGGSPTFLHPDHMRQLGEVIHRRFSLAADVEAGVEIDPRRLVRDHVVALREIGFNRASLGVQDHNPVVQKAVHRIQPFDQTKRAVDWVRETGFRSVNIDLIYGLPHQTPASFELTLDEVLTLSPDRFAIFNYAYVPWMKPAQKIIKEEVMPTAETKFQLLKLTIEKLTAGGYVYIGMDHFARVDDELAVAQRQKTLQRNFQGYSTRGGADIYAFGMSSISQTDALYWQNRKELPAYYEALHANGSRFFVGSQMWEIDYAATSERLGIDFSAAFAAELAGLGDMESDGLIRRTAQGLEVTSLGRLFIRNIAMRFDAHLSQETVRRYSRTV